MTGSKKKGLSIGAAMKQRMDSQDEQPTSKTKEAMPEPNKSLRDEENIISSPLTSPAEAEVLESFNTRLPRGLHRRLKVHTALEGHKIQDVVAQALDEYLKHFERKES